MQSDWTVLARDFGDRYDAFVVRPRVPSNGSCVRFYDQDVAHHVSIRLDPFLFGGLAAPKEAHHGQMRANNPAENGELTELVWGTEE